jgi:predicted ATPase
MCAKSHCGALFTGYRERPAMVGKLRSYETMMMLLERQMQLQQLETLLGDAIGGHGRVAVLAGEAGAGKTALVEAFAARVGQSAATLRSACEDLSIPDPLGPLYDLAREAQWALPRAIDARHGQ